MNNLKKVCIFLLILIANNSCNIHDDKRNEKLPIIRFDRNSFPTVTILEAEEIDFDAPLNPATFEIISDSLIIAHNWTGNPYYMELYNINDKQPVMNFAKRGRGPNEYLSAYISYKTHLDDSFILFDIHTNRASLYSIDSLMLLGEKYTPERIKIPHFIGNDIAQLDSSTFLIFNKYFVNDKKYSNNIDKCLFAFDKHEDIDYSVISDGFKYFTHNVTDGFIAVSPSHDKVWVFYQKENRIEVFNKLLEPVKTLIGPETFEPDYYIREGTNNHISFKISTRTYWRSFYNNDHIYVIYIGEYDKKQEQPRNIFKFNWNGDLLHRYQLDRNLYTIYVDTQEEYIIGTEYIPGHYPKLIKYKL